MSKGIERAAIDKRPSVPRARSSASGPGGPELRLVGHYRSAASYFLSDYFFVSASVSGLREIISWAPRGHRGGGLQSPWNFDPAKWSSGCLTVPFCSLFASARPRSSRASCFRRRLRAHASSREPWRTLFRPFSRVRLNFRIFLLRQARILAGDLGRRLGSQVEGRRCSFEDVGLIDHVDIITKKFRYYIYEIWILTLCCFIEFHFRGNR